MRAIADLLHEAGELGMRDTQEVWPYVTGRSRNGFRIERVGLVTRIRNDVPYSGFVFRRGRRGRERQLGLDETHMPTVVVERIEEVVKAKGDRAALIFVAAAMEDIDRG